MAEDGARTEDARIDRPTLIGLLVAALVVRLLYTILRDVGNPIPVGSDANSYDAFARAILSGTRWILHPGPELFRPPGYPFALAFLYTLTASHLAVVQCLQSLVGVGSVLLIYVFGCRHVGRTPALLAAIWLVVNPLHLDYNGKLLRETWLVFLNVALLVSLLSRDGLRVKGLLRTALLFTILAHFDSRYVFHLPFFGGYLLFAGMSFAGMSFAGPKAGKPHFDFLPSARRFILFTLFVLAFSSPWAIRNALAYDRFVLIDTRALDRWAKRAETAVTGDALSPPEVLARFEADKEARFATLTREEQQAFRAGIRPQFGQPHKAIFNFCEFWRIFHFNSEYRPFPDGRFASPWSLEHNLSSLVFIGLLLPAFLVGAARGIAALDRVTLVLVAFVAVHTLLHVLVHSVTRYRLPIEPFVALMSFQEMARWLPRRPE